MLALAVECCLRSFMKAFCCDNYKDEAALQELMRRHYPKGNRPQIIVCTFSEKVYNIQGRSAAAAQIRRLLRFTRFTFCFPSFCRKADHPEYPSVLDIITAPSPVVINCLIDMRGIESILIIKVSAGFRACSR